jgi:hypothetical protein
VAQGREIVEGNGSIHGNTVRDDMEYGKGPCLKVFTEVNGEDEENIKKEPRLEFPDKDLIELEVSSKNVNRETEHSHRLLKNPKDSSYGDIKAVKWADTSRSMRNKLP